MKAIILALALIVSACSHTNSKTPENSPVYNKYLDGFAYPYPVKSFSFNSQRQELKMRYMDVGDKTSKKVALLLHGKNFSGFYWKKIADQLVTKGYRVVIPDQIGFGKSSKPNNYQYSFAQLALNTNKLLEELKIDNKVHIVGHSMGGMLAVHFTLHYPSKISKLTLVNPIGLEPYSKYTQLKDPMFFYEKAEKNKNIEKIRNYQKKNYYAGKWNDDYEALIKIHEGWLNGPDWDIIAWNNSLTYLPIFSEDITSRLHEINMDLTLIIGTRDRTGPGRGWMKKGTNYELGRYDKLGKAFKKRLPTAKVIELKDLGHMPQIEDYERFKKVFFPEF